MSQDESLTRQQRRAKGRKARRQGASTMALGALSAAAALEPALQAATITVTSLADDTTNDAFVTLREAVESINAAAPVNAGVPYAGTFGTGDTVVFQAGLTGTINLASGELPLNEPMTIDGPGSSLVTVDAGDASRIFYLYSSTAPDDFEINGLTLTDGLAGVGGAISGRQLESLTLSDVTFDSNQSTKGAGGALHLYDVYSLTIENSVFTGNETGAKASGGGAAHLASIYRVEIHDSVFSYNTAAGKGGSGGAARFYNVSEVEITGSEFSDNEAGRNGGGLAFYKAGTIDILDSTISGNNANSDGGGLYAGAVTTKVRLPAPGSGVTAAIGATSDMTLANVTISGNTALDGGGIYLYEVNTVLLDHATIVENTADDGTALHGAYLDLTVQNSILADSTESSTPRLGQITGEAAASDPDIYLYEVDFNLAFSLIENLGATTYTDNGGNLIGQDPNLGPLTNNGGATETHRPNPGSPVIHAGDPAFSDPDLTNDQRGTGFARTVGPRTDMGAVELQISEGGGGTGPTPATEIPTLGGAGAAALGAGLAGAATAVLRRRRKSPRA